MDNWLSDVVHNVVRDPFLWGIAILWLLVDLFFRFKTKRKISFCTLLTFARLQILNFQKTKFKYYENYSVKR